MWEEWEREVVVETGRDPLRALQEWEEWEREGGWVPRGRRRGAGVGGVEHLEGPTGVCGPPEFTSSCDTP